MLRWPPRRVDRSIRESASLAAVAQFHSNDDKIQTSEREIAKIHRSLPGIESPIEGGRVRCNAFLPNKLWEVKMAELGGGGGKRRQTGFTIVADSGIGIS